MSTPAADSASLSPAESGAVAAALEPLHSMIYFAPEAEERYTALGLPPGQMGYFASRSAPMGAVGAGVVTAAFYNFNPRRVARFVPSVWSITTPPDLIAARSAVADAALRRLLGADVLASAELAEAAGLARTAAEACSGAGRPLAAAHLDLGWPQPPHLVLWHAASILREHRGDGHVAVLTTTELSGLEALVTFTATGKGFVPPFALRSRGWSAQEWAHAEAGLRERGLLDAEGAPTARGREQRARIEADTDRLGHGPWAALGADGTRRLGELAGGLSSGIITEGAFPDGVFAPGSPRSARRR